MTSTARRLSSLRDREEKKEEKTTNDAPRLLKEREIINLFMSAGIFENVARSVVKNCHELNALNEKTGEDFKAILREALSVLEKEGVPPSIWEEVANKHQAQVAILMSDGSASKENQPSRPRIAVCKICKDSAVIHPAYPKKMKEYFQEMQDFRGELKKADWLCRECYADFYRDNREWIKEQEEKKAQGDSTAEEDPESSSTVEEDENSGKAPRKQRKEMYIKNIAALLALVAKNMHPSAISHRKMLVRYIALGQIHNHQLPVALYYLRKTGNGIIDQEDFEKECGIGKYADLFGFSSWKKKPAEREILHLNEAERNRRKLERQQKWEAEERERLQKAADDRKEADRIKQQEEQVKRAQKEAEDKARAEKWKKIQENRKKEDEELAEAKKKADLQKEKQKEKKENEKKAAQKAREKELKDVEIALKKREDDLKRRQEERYRKQRQESQQRALEIRNTAKLMNI